MNGYHHHFGETGASFGQNWTKITKSGGSYEEAYF